MKLSISRFKTSSELQSERGESWRAKAGMNQSGSMDYLLGKRLTFDQAKSISGTGRVVIDSWYINTGMITTEEFEVSGVKLLKELPGVPAGVTLEYDEDSQDFGIEHAGGDYYFSIEEIIDNVDWFELILAHFKKTVSVGNPSRQVVITSGGVVNIVGNVGTTTIARLQELRHRIFRTPMIDELDIFDEHSQWLKSIWIGCEESGTLVTEADLNSIIEEHQRMVSK